MIPAIGGVIDWLFGREQEGAPDPSKDPAHTCAVIQDDVFDPQTEWVVIGERQINPLDVTAAVPAPAPDRRIQWLANLHFVSCVLEKQSKWTIVTHKKERIDVNHVLVQEGMEQSQLVLDQIFQKVSPEEWELFQPWMQRGSLIEKVKALFQQQYTRKNQEEPRMDQWFISIQFSFTPEKLPVAFGRMRHVQQEKDARKFTCLYHPNSDKPNFRWD